MEMDKKHSYEQEQRWAMDCQTAEHLWNTGQYAAVIDHIDGMYGWKPRELERIPGVTDKELAERCMRAAGI